MNGRELLSLQIRSGTRGIVEEIDNLRLLLGFERVKVLTPKAETTLRKGHPAKIPLSIMCRLQDCPIELVLAFPSGYPAAEIEVTECNVTSADGSLRPDDSLKEKLKQSCERLRGEQNYAAEIISLAKSLFHFSEENIVSALSDEGLRGSDISNSISLLAPSLKLYSCRMCRTNLFYSSFLETHESTGKCCTVFLREPPRDACTDLDSGSAGGKILCPACDTKLGAWSWIGSQCSCKCIFCSFIYNNSLLCLGLFWVSPAFHIPLSKLDHIHVEDESIPVLFCS
jgi:hypothetical protein